MRRSVPLDRRVAAYVLVGLIVAALPVVLATLQYRSLRAEGFSGITWTALVVQGMARWYVWFAVVPVMQRRARQVDPDWPLRRRIDRHVRVFVAFAPLHAVLVMLVERELGSVSAAGLLASMVPQVLADLIWYAGIAGALAIADTRRRQTETAARLRTEVAEARLESLRQQLNPHFLFNTLNHMAVLLRARQSDAALGILLPLSELLRKLLKDQAQLVPLRDELATVERYLEIERARFGDRLVAELTYEPKALDATVPSLMLQPLLENAMRHGVSKADGTCRVTLTARIRNARLQLEVRDAGPGLETPGSPEGVGLRNTRQRLRYLYGDDHRMDLGSLPGGGLLVAIDLPVRA